MSIALPGPAAEDARAQPTAAGLAHLALPAGDLADPAALLRAVDDAASRTPGDGARGAVLALLRATLEEGRAQLREALLAEPQGGLRIARSHAHLTDAVVMAAVHYAREHLHVASIPTTGEQLAVIGVGGYGRGEMAPFSDVDLLFLLPYKNTAWAESVVESTLYLLWDLKLKVGQAVRSVDDCLRYAATDLTIRTGLLEMRFLCGDPEPFDALDRRLWAELFDRTGPEFVEAKIAERDARHERTGGSRYLLEPNVKEGKGGLRDLQTLHWISKYLYHTGTAWDLVERGVFREDEVQRFADAAKFIWAVRCHLHDLAGRAQEHLSFDRQVEIAERMGYVDGAGRQAVEHFMHAYFRHAKNVGDLTRIFSAMLEARHAKKGPRLSLLLRALSFRSDGEARGPFTVRDGRLTLAEEDAFEREPLDILRLFRESARLDARIHPEAMRAVMRSLDRIDDALRADPEANRLFLDMLMNREHGEWLLRLMNETDVLGRFIPEFGQIVAMMQFNMYHHYTVDEHTIQVCGMAGRIERLEEREAHPVATDIVASPGLNRRVLYVALFLHDIGKGQRRDHSEVGAEIAGRLCPRLGLTPAETETVVWLVRHHLLMSDTAQKRDIADARTIRDFADIVRSPERLRLLTVLTVCDIRGVGPGVWNNWKAQLIRALYRETRDVLSGAPDRESRAARVARARAALAEALPDWRADALEAEAARHYPHYWLGLDTATQAVFARLAREEGGGIQTRFMADESRDATKACLYMPDHPGLFARMAGAFALAGADVVDARTYTTTDGMACSTFWIQDHEGHPFDPSRLDRLKSLIDRTLAGEVVAGEALEQKERARPREQSFTVPTRIVFDNDGSELYTIVEVNARDRRGLLHALARTLADLNFNIFSAIIATYGEHAVDVFYVKDLFGLKIGSTAKQRLIEDRLTRAIEDIEDRAAGA